MATLNWSFPSDVPTTNIFDDYDPSDRGLQGQILEDLIWQLERQEFHTWEAVVRQEQGLPLSKLHRRRLASLLDFRDDYEDPRILYIDEIPRPSHLWYEIVRTFVPHLVINPFCTFDIHYAEATEGWPRLAVAIEKHAKGLSLPEGVSKPIEVVPAELRHQLWLQFCFEHLSGLGQEPELTLLNPEQCPWRITEFIDELRRHKDSVKYLELTLNKLLTMVSLPETDVPVFVQLMQEQLKLKSRDEPIAGRLKRKK